jgi:hypothetical protein
MRYTYTLRDLFVLTAVVALCCSLTPVFVCPSYTTSRSSERWTGFTYHHSDALPGVAGVPGLRPPHSINLNALGGWSRRFTPQSEAQGFARPSSNHPNCVQMMFCDNHVRALDIGKMSYGVYQALMTPDGANARDNSTRFGLPLAKGHAATAAVDEGSIP